MKDDYALDLIHAERAVHELEDALRQMEWGRARRLAAEATKSISKIQEWLADDK